MLSLHLSGCIEVQETGASANALLGPAGDYEDIYYHHCLGYDGDDDNPSANPSACTQDSQCSNHADCPSGKTCSCDLACGCCVVEDWDEPKPNETFTRYMWTSCPASGACDATITKGNETKFFSKLANLGTTGDLIDKLCMMHVEADNGCIYTTGTSGSNCSLASDDPNAGKYECGNKVCADNEIVLCTGAFTYTLIKDYCAGSEMPIPETAELPAIPETQELYCTTNMYGEEECSPI